MRTLLGLFSGLIGGLAVAKALGLLGLLRDTHDNLLVFYLRFSQALLAAAALGGVIGLARDLLAWKRSGASARAIAARLAATAAALVAIGAAGSWVASGSSSDAKPEAVAAAANSALSVRTRPTLFDAINSGNPKDVQWALEWVEPTEEVDDVSALQLAIRQGRPQIVEILLKKGARPSRCPSEPCPIADAIARGRADILKLLVLFEQQAGADELWSAVERKDVKTTQLLLEAGVKPDYDQLLYSAVDSGSRDLVRLLVAHGAKPSKDLAPQVETLLKKRR